MTYHTLPICKHQMGSPWKIQEELFEYIDAVGTDNPVMATQELSDLYGVLEAEAKKYGLTMDNLKTMSDLTKKVFITGRRKSESLYQEIVRDAIKIGFIDCDAIAFMPNEFIYVFVKDGHAYCDDITKMKIVLEVVKGECNISDGTDSKDSFKENVKLTVIESEKAELFFSDNTIIKVKPFNAIPIMDEIDEDDEALSIIRAVCEAGETNE